MGACHVLEGPVKEGPVGEVHLMGQARHRVDLDRGDDLAPRRAQTEGHTPRAREQYRGARRTATPDLRKRHVGVHTGSRHPARSILPDPPGANGWHGYFPKRGCWRPDAALDSHHLVTSSDSSTHIRPTLWPRRTPFCSILLMYCGLTPARVATSRTLSRRLSLRVAHPGRILTRVPRLRKGNRPSVPGLPGGACNPIAQGTRRGRCGSVLRGPSFQGLLEHPADLPQVLAELR